jgi:Protein kinase domain/PEGA domain
MGTRVCPTCGAVIGSPARAARPGPGAGSGPTAGAKASDTPEQVQAQLQRAVASLYMVERLLGRGEASFVFEATEINPPRPVALKVLPPGLGQGASSARFKDEARKAMALAHAGIAAIYRVGLRGGAPYFVAMRLVDGPDLGAVLASQGALPLPALLVVLRSVAEALDYAHTKGTVHGHLTAANVLLDRTGRVVVTDFGMAADAAPGGARRFLSPEQAAGGAPGPASDRYALGMLALRMLTGSVPRDADPLAQLRDARTLRDGLPDALQRLVQTALAQDPARRYAGTSELLAAIKAIPLGDAERREGHTVLGQLARGEAVPKVAPPASVPAPDATQTARTEVRPAIPQPRLIQPTVQELGVTPLGDDLMPASAAGPSAAPTQKAPGSPPARDSVPAEPVAPRSPARPPAPVHADIGETTRSPAMPTRPRPVFRHPPTGFGLSTGPAVPDSALHRSRLPWVLAALLLLVAAGAAYWFFVRYRAATQMAEAPSAAAPPASPAPVNPAPATDSARPDTVPTAAATGTPAATPAAPAAIPARPARPVSGWLMLNATPTSAQIVVDGTPSSDTGFWDAAVRPGRREVEISAPGYVTFDTVIAMGAGDTLDLGEVDLRKVPAVNAAPPPRPTTGKVRLTVVPPTAQIFVDGSPVGVGALVDFQIAPGRWRLRISAPGYETVDTSVTVTVGATVTLGQITLRNAPGGP